MQTVYVKRYSNQSPFELTSDKTDARDFVDKALAAPTLRTAIERYPDYIWGLIPVDQTGGIVYLVAGRPVG